MHKRFTRVRGMGALQKHLPTDVGFGSIGEELSVSKCGPVCGADIATRSADFAFGPLAEVTLQVTSALRFFAELLPSYFRQEDDSGLDILPLEPTASLSPQLAQSAIELERDNVLPVSEGTRLNFGTIDPILNCLLEVKWPRGDVNPSPCGARGAQARAICSWHRFTDSTQAIHKELRKRT